MYNEHKVKEKTPNHLNLTLTYQEKKTQDDRNMIEAYNNLAQQKLAIIMKITEKKEILKEYDILIKDMKQIKAVDPARNCWRIIEDEIASGTVCDYVHCMVDERKMFEEDFQKLQEELKAKEKELREFAAEYRVTQQQLCGFRRGIIIEKWSLPRSRLRKWLAML